MNNNTDISHSIGVYFENRIKQSIKNFSKKTINNFIDNRKENYMKKSHEKTYAELYRNYDYIETEKSKALDEVRNNMYYKRENILFQSPYLFTMLNHIKNSNINFSDNVLEERNSDKLSFEKQKTISKQKRYFNVINNRNVQFENNKEKDLDNDGVPDRIDIDDTRNSVQTVSDLSSKKTQRKKILQEKNKKSTIKFEKDLLEEKIITEDQKKKTVQNRLRNPLISSQVGSRNVYQKIIVSPINVLSNTGSSIKKDFNREIDSSEMAGVQLANDVVSPLTKKLKFETTSLLSKKIGFDSKAHKLKELEKSIIKADKKALLIKKTQRKKIRKIAVNNSKAMTSKITLTNRIKSATDNIKLGMKKISSNLFHSKGVGKLLGAGLGLILTIIVPATIIFPVLASTTGLTTTSAQEQENTTNFNFVAGSLPQSVLRWENNVLNELKKYNLESYKDLALVIIMLESGGRSETLPDVMQSSESIGLSPNSIKNPQHSIEVGINYLRQLIAKREKLGVDLQSMIHSYNYGGGFMDYVKTKNNGVWTQELANEFSTMWKNRLGWSIYGDPSYVQKALKYLSISGNGEIKFNAEFDLEKKQMPYPVPNYTYISSNYGYRIHPVRGGRSFHSGIDFPAPAGTPIIATADGVVTFVDNYGSSGYGLYLIVNHGSGVETLYAHNSKILVKNGQTVKAGDVIALIGTTGTSTGNHLHYEIRVNGQYINPLSWLNK